MPIYEYRCNGCGHRFAYFSRTMSSSAEAAPVACPHCQSNDTKRLVSSFAVQGPSGPDAAEIAAEKAQAERLASITPREQIEKWRSAAKK
ncbi:MAG: zinc ribbon domain-containing protein [Chloroflexi bacterium]|nr:zinc ribbon domain-containing protein [Chloroflexota bacterium]